MSAPGSTSPDRVPITRPSSGVNPIEVSTLLPPRKATILAPLPRCAMITRPSASGLPAEHIRRKVHENRSAARLHHRAGEELRTCAPAPEARCGTQCRSTRSGEDWEASVIQIEFPISPGEGDQDRAAEAHPV